MKDDPGFIELRRFDAAKEIAATMARSRNRVFLNADSLLLNLLERSTPAPSMPSKQPFGARVPTFRKERRMRPFRGGTVKYGENKINSLSDAIDRTNSVYFYFYKYFF